MQLVKITLLLSLFIGIQSNPCAQNADLLKELPETKEESINSEKNALATIDWLENTPLNQNPEKHRAQYALLLGWVTNSPNVTVELDENILVFTKKNNDLLIFFIAGWTKYCLENNYSKDSVKGNTAGLRSVTRIYQKGVGLKKDKKIQKLIALEDKGELEKWVTEQLSKK